MTATTTDTEALVRRAYQLAEGNVMDVQGFRALFAADGMVNAGGQSYRGEHLGDPVVFLGKLAPDVHRVHVMGNVVAVELSIRGTFTGPFETPAGVIQPTGAKLDFPGPISGTCGRRQDQGVQLLRPSQHHARAAGRESGLRIRSRSAGGREIKADLQWCTAAPHCNSPGIGAARRRLKRR